MKPKCMALAALVAAALTAEGSFAQTVRGDAMQTTNDGTARIAGQHTPATTVPEGPVKQPPTGFDVGMIHNPHVFHPGGAVAGVVFLISDAPGWEAADEAEAATLSAKGYAVVGLDLPTYLQGLAGPSGDADCSYAISDIEEISKRLQSDAGRDYHLPVIAGRGDGAGLALALVSQAPASTIGATVAVDPSESVALLRPLCTDAPHEVQGDRIIYGLLPGQVNQPVDAVFTSSATPETRAHASALAADHPEITVSDAAPGSDATTTLASAIDTRLGQLSEAEGPLNLPIEEMPVAKPAFDTMAVFWSGDGGWRDIDRQVGQYLQQAGIPVAGVDSLRYFWSERQPQETADDLARIIRHYRETWRVRHVVLIGYSFGADILPESYDRLSAADRHSVVLMSLMSLTHQRDYEVHVSGWLGLSSDSGQDPVKDLQKVPAGLVQCIGGEGDDEDACHDLKGRGYDLITLSGGHHFDGDYETLTGHILDALKARI